jgi:hypothetical protein
MKRQTTYKGFIIETEIFFNYNAERSLNGKKWHKILVKAIDTSDNSILHEAYEEVLSTTSNSEILEYCAILENNMLNFINKKLSLSDNEEFFLENGFTKTNNFSR